ncbi:MAG: hypothetical protein QOI94_1644, partial [Acidobacteriaceae bacterium]|nr:hypothetical protein [Acidobacteriaceae bacterium]
MTFARQAGTAAILVALLRSGRKPHRYADVRIVGELSVRHRDA